MALIYNKEFENTYTSSDGSIFIDFDAIDNETFDEEENEEDEKNH